MTDSPSESSHVRAGRLAVPLSAITFAASRSSGPGGQNVNKVNTRMELRLPLSAVEGATVEIMQRLRMLCGKRLTSADELRLVVQETRSLEQNRALALEHLAALLEEASHIPRKRRPTKPSRGSRRRRLESKQQRSQLKSLRGPSNQE